jgi:hypothetical protein
LLLQQLLTRPDPDRSHSDGALWHCHNNKGQKHQRQRLLQLLLLMRGPARSRPLVPCLRC